MKTFGSLQKKSASRPTPIPLTTHLFQSRPFQDTLPSKTVQSKSQAQADIQTKLDRLRRANPDYAQLGIQRKLTVGAPNDQYEQEADRVADQVMNTSDAAVQQSVQRESMPEEEEVQTKPLAASMTPLVQREAMPEEEEVQTKAIAPTLQWEEMPEEEEVQTKPLGDTLQREEMPEEEEVQTKSFGGIQREEMPEEEEVQTKPYGSIQREAMPEEEEVLQTKALENGWLQREEMPEEEEIQTKLLTNTLQRQEMPEEEEAVQTKPSLQRSTDGILQAGGNLEGRLNSSKGGGSPLPQDVKTFMESRFRTDFSQVRVHTDSEAVQMNRDLNAQAFTRKQDVYFGAGKTPGKDALTAHELTHVVQQTEVVQAKQLSKQPLQLKCLACEKEEVKLQRFSEMSTAPIQSTRLGFAASIKPVLQPTLQRSCVGGNWQFEYDGCSLPSKLANIVEILGGTKDNPAGGIDTHFALAKPTSHGGKACDRHDECYQTCGSDRNQCNIQMYDDMMAVCESSKDSYTVKQKCYDWAHMYWDGLFAGSAPTFKERQKEVCACPSPSVPPQSTPPEAVPPQSKSEFHSRRFSGQSTLEACGRGEYRMLIGEKDSEAVQKVQESLIEAGISVQVNGIYSEETRQAVAKFKREHNPQIVPSDGVVGPQTSHALDDIAVEHGQ